MDDISKKLAGKSNLPFLHATPKGARGSDFIKGMKGE